MTDELLRKWAEEPLAAPGHGIDDALVVRLWGIGALLVLVLGIGVEPAAARDVSRPSQVRTIVSQPFVESVGVVRTLPGSHDLQWFFSRDEAGTDCGSLLLGTCWGNADQGDVLVPGDYNGDRTTDVAVYRPGSPASTWHVIYGDARDGPLTTAPSPVFESFAFGDSGHGDIPVPADYDRDGLIDMAVYRPGSPASTWIVRLSTGGFLSRQFGDAANGDAPVPADFDCDGRADLAVRRVAADDDTELIFEASSTGPDDSVGPGARGSVTSRLFGTAADTYVPGDFDGDSCADRVVVRSLSDGNLGWFFDSSRAGFGFVEWGLVTDVPAAGDFNGDGLTDIGAWRMTDHGEMLARNSDGGALIASGPFGDPGDRLVNAAYNQTP